MSSSADALAVAPAARERHAVALTLVAIVPLAMLLLGTLLLRRPPVLPALEWEAVAASLDGPSVAITASALVATIVTLWLGFFADGADVLLRPFLATVTLSTAAVIMLTVVLDHRGRDRPFSSWDAVASLLLAVSLAASVVGIVAATVVVAHLAAERAAWRRWIVSVLPIVAWGVWFAAEGTLRTERWSWDTRWQFATDLVQRTTQRLAARSTVLGCLLAAGCGAVLWASRYRWHTFDLRVWRWLAGAAVWVALATYRSGTVLYEEFALEPSFVDGWVLAVLLVMSVVEAARGQVARVARRMAAIAVVLLLALIAGSARLLIEDVRKGRDAAATSAEIDREGLLAVESLERGAHADWTVWVGGGAISATTYEQLVTRLASPLPRLGLERRLDEAGIMRQDEIITEGMGLTVQPGFCSWVPAEGAAEIGVSPGATAVVSAGEDSSKVFVARRSEFSLGTSVLGTVAPNETALIRVSRDGSGMTWRVRATDGAVAARCVDEVAE